MAIFWPERSLDQDSPLLLSIFLKLKYQSSLCFNVNPHHQFHGCGAPVYFSLSLRRILSLYVRGLFEIQLCFESWLLCHTAWMVLDYLLCLISFLSLCYGCCVTHVDCLGLSTLCDKFLVFKLWLLCYTARMFLDYLLCLISFLYLSYDCCVTQLEWS